MILLPCPFCGEEAKLTTEHRYYQVECKGCGVNSGWENKERVIELWNIRNIDYTPVKYDPNYRMFGLIGEPFDKKQHQNQQAGLDKYVRVVNFSTGEICVKKLYEAKKGVYFKHTGFSPTYLSDMVSLGYYISHQTIF